MLPGNGRALSRRRTTFILYGAVLEATSLLWVLTDPVDKARGDSLRKRHYDVKQPTFFHSFITIIERVVLSVEGVIIFHLLSGKRR